MFRTSPTLVMQLLIDIINDKFGRDDYGKDEARILSASFMSKDLIRADYLIFGAKKAFNFL